MERRPGSPPPCDNEDEEFSHNDGESDDGSSDLEEGAAEIEDGEASSAEEGEVAATEEPEEGAVEDEDEDEQGIVSDRVPLPKNITHEFEYEEGALVELKTERYVRS